MTFIDSDGLPSIDPSQMGSEPEVTETPQSVPVETGGPEPEPTFTGYMKSIYDKVPENERPLVAKHLKEADTGFQNYAKQTQERIKSYEALGPVEDLQTARALYQTLLSNPQAIYDYLVDPEGGGLTPRQAETAIAKAEDAIDQPSDPRYDSLAKQLEDVKKLTTALFANTQQQTEKAQQEENTRQYYAVLDQIEEQHNVKDQVDRNVIHRFVASGMDPADAYTEYFRLRDQFTTSQPQTAKRPPPTMLTAGGVPRPPKAIGDMSEEEQNSYLENSLREIARNNQ